MNTSIHQSYKYPWKLKFSLFVIIFSFGLFLRLQFVYRNPFPMNDGGFFLSMIQDLQNNHFKIPKFTIYNNLDIPFAYPPLSIYSAAFLNQFLNIDLFDIFRIYPLLFNLLSIPLFYFLCKELTETNSAAFLATAIYTVMNPSYEWLISGGGLTRSPAHTLFIVSLTLFLVYLRTSKKWVLIFSIISAALMTLHHLEYTWMLVYSIFIFTFFQRKRIKSAPIITFYGLGLLVLTAPYWFTVVRIHGPSPFMNAFSTGGFKIYDPIFRLFLLDFTSEAPTKIINILVFLGLFTCISKKNIQMIIWFLSILFLNSRSPDRMLIFPVCILASYSLDYVIIPGLNHIHKKFKSPSPKSEFSGEKNSSRLGYMFNFSFIFLLLFMDYLSLFTSQPVLSSLSSDEIKAMEWVRSSSNLDSRFLVVESSSGWATDRTGEWFPALAKRHSITTMQGREWLPERNFLNYLLIHQDFKQCLGEGISCLLTWSDKNSISFSHVFISKTECGLNKANCTNYMISTTHAHPDFSKVYENEGVVIYEHES